MNRIKLIACSHCHADRAESCKDAAGHIRHNPITHREMFHRARIEEAVRTVGLVEKGAQPPQLARFRQRNVLDLGAGG